MATQLANLVGAYEAKTHFSALLEKVEAGEEVTITKHGTPVARLVPIKKQTTQAERDNTGAMVNIGRPDVAEQLMTAAGLLPGTRTSLRLHWEFPDTELAARALASTGPAYLVMQHIGEEAFMAAARDAAAGLYVEGIGVRAEVELQFLVGVVPV